MIGKCGPKEVEEGLISGFAHNPQKSSYPDFKLSVSLYIINICPLDRAYGYASVSHVRTVHREHAYLRDKTRLERR